MSIFRTAIVSLLICLSFSFLVAQPFSNAVTVRTVSASQTEVSFTLPPFKLTEQTEKIGTFHKIEMEEAFSSGETGLPNMPHFSAVLAVPIDSEVSISVADLSQPRYMDVLPIYPVQNYDVEGYTFDYEQSFYESNNPKITFPTTSYFLSDVYTMRDYQYVVVKINPIKYIPSDNTIEITDTFHITISHTTKDSNPSYTIRPVMSRAFENLYEHTFMNYNQVRSQNPVYQEPSILIIYGGTSSNHNAEFMNILNGIVNYKEQKGFKVRTASTITTGTGTTAIKSYIQNLFNTAVNPPEWIVLLGATGGSYSIPCYPNIGSSDYQYTFLAGPANDIVGDAFIGRISVNNWNDLNGYWQKMQRYELNTPPVEPSLYKKAMLVGSSAQSGVSTYIVNRYIKNIISDYDPSFSFLEVYAGHVGNQVPSFSQGHSQYNFRGYINMDGFSSSYNAVNNTNVLTNMVMLTCGTGYYDNPGTSEGFMRRMHSSGPAGAILATGMSSSATKTEYNNAEAGAIFYALYVIDVPTMGEALLYAKTYLTQVYPGNYYTSNTIHWTNLMGDPSLHVFKTAPKTFGTVLPTTVPTGTQAFYFNITDSVGSTVPDAWVTISTQSGSYISKAIADNDGIAFLPLDTEQTGPFLITISKAGFFPKRGPVSLSSTEQTVSVTGHICYDPPPGNNNQTINPGEAINLTIKVKNFLSSPVTNLTATISSNNEYVTFTGNTSYLISSIAPGLEGVYDDAFSFTVSSQTPDKTLLPLTITITDGSSTWTSFILPEIHGIDIKVTNMNPTTLNIGSSTNILFALKNEGIIPSGSLQANLISRSLYLSTTDEVITIPNIAVNATVTQTVPFNVSVVNFMMPGIKLKADLHLFSEYGYEAYIPLDLPIGVKQVTDPTGPDDYGYVIYHSNDSDLEERPVYNWININSIGQNTGITDTSASGEEGKATIILPFTAGFYGEQYDRITVCSNGWLVFGDTAQKDFRNLPLPGPVAPKALVSPYWTDLVVGGSYGGGIYKYYHEQEHAFIIQFDKLKWVLDYGYGSSLDVSADSVSFQVLIYDPAYNGTVLGNSKIKFQYRRFNPGFQGPDEHPFNFITVGIQDHTYKRGLQYSYNNVYSPGSNTITNESALLITQPNYLIEAPYVQVMQVYYHPESGGDTIIAGENLDIGISLINVGSQTAENVTARLLINSPFIDMIQSNATFNDIESSLTQSNLNYFRIHIRSTIPNNTVITGALTVTADGTEEPIVWHRQIGFTVTKPTIQYRSYLLNDAQPGGNDDGIINPGETIKLIVNIANTSALDITNVTASITSTSQQISIANSSVNISKMKANSFYQTAFEIAMDPLLQETDNIPIIFSATSQNTSLLEREIALGVNQSTSIFQEYFQGWPTPSWIFTGFTSYWSRSQTNNAGGSIPEIVYSEPTGNGTPRLISPIIDTTDITRVLLTFRHNLLVAQSGLGTTIGVASRRSNSEGWITLWEQEVNDDIAATMQSIEISNHTLNSATFQFCFYLSGDLSAISKWYIDNAIVQNAIGNTATLTGRVSVSDNIGEVVGLKITAGDYSVPVLPDSTYTMYLLPRSYPSISVVDPYYIGNVYYSIDVTSGQILQDYNFNLHYKAPTDTLWIDAIVENTQNNTKDITLKWHHRYNYEADNLLFNRFNIYGQINSAEFVFLGSSIHPDYTTNVSTANIYRFYVTAVYSAGESEPCPPKYINPITMEVETSESDEIIMPFAFGLQQNYPNPFNPTTTIAFTISDDSIVNLSVYNIKGQRVKTLLNEQMPKGAHTIVWNGKDGLGRDVASGIYFYRLNAGGFVNTKKMLLLK